jgi:hypothetical protein
VRYAGDVLRGWAIALLPAAVLVAACSGGGGSSKTPTPAAELTPTAAASPTPAPVPARPTSLRDYAQTAATYLTASPGAASDCLIGLYAAWTMPLIATGTGCTAANADGDAENELVVTFAAAGSSTGDPLGTQFVIAVLDHGAAGYGVAYQSDVEDVAPPGGTQPISPLIFAGDLLGSGRGGLVFETATCGASTCTQEVHVERGTASGYVSLAPADRITIATATSIKVEDTDGDGTKEILLTGGELGSVGAGPQRQHEDVWAWNGTAYALRSSSPAASTYLYHAVKDADAPFASGKYADAEAAYLATVGNDSLQTFYPDKNERNELEAYALFRAGLSELMKGGDRTTADSYFARANGYDGTLNHQLAGSFEAAYAAKGEVSVGCSAVREDIQSNLAEYSTFWDFGYGNPSFDPNAVCPF